MSNLRIPTTVAPILIFLVLLKVFRAVNVLHSEWKTHLVDKCMIVRRGSRTAILFKWTVERGLDFEDEWVS